MHALKKMGGMIFILLGHLFVIDKEHIAINCGNMSIGPAKNLKRPINDFVSGYDVMIVT